MNPADYILTSPGSKNDTVYPESPTELKGTAPNDLGKRRARVF